MSIKLSDNNYTPEPKVPQPLPKLPKIEACHDSTAKNPKPKKRKLAETQTIGDDGDRDVLVNGRTYKKRKIITNEVRELIRLQSLGNEIHSKVIQQHLLLDLRYNK